MSRNVLVIGMHRSGTSATTRLINLLGVPICPAGQLIAAGPGNEAGYWESAPLAGFNEELLTHLGGSWWRPPAVTAERLATVAGAWGDRALARFQRSYPAGPWVWKDPRNCLLLPFWRPLLGADPVVVLALRNLHDVCRSLHARNAFPVEWSLAMCERYLGHALRALAGLPVVVTRYEELVEDPAAWLAGTADALTALGVRVTQPPAADVAAFVRPELQHSRHTEADLRPLPRTAAQRALIGIVSGLRGPYPAFPSLSVPAESAPTTALLATPGSPVQAVRKPPASPRRPAPQPLVTIVAEAGSDDDLSRRALAACVASAPDGSEVLLTGPAGPDLEADLQPRWAGVTVRSCGSGELADAAAPGAPGYLVFTTGLAHPHPCWAQALTGAFADERTGAAGATLRAWHAPGWSAAGLRVGDAALNGVWLEAGPEPGIRDVPLLSRHFMAVRRSVLAEVGGLDAAMAPGSVWDWELCARIWRAGYRIVTAPEAAATVRFDGDGPASLPAFRRNLLRFAALHLGLEPLTQLLTALDVRNDPGLVLDVLAAEAPGRRRWLATTLPVGSDGYSQHLFAARDSLQGASALTPQA